MRATSLQEHEAERYNHAVVGMESSHLQRGCKAPRLTPRERAVLELLCRYDHVPQVAAALFVQPERCASICATSTENWAFTVSIEPSCAPSPWGLSNRPQSRATTPLLPEAPTQEPKRGKFPQLGNRKTGMGCVIIQAMPSAWMAERGAMMMLRHRVGYSAFARGVGRVLSRWWSGCVWLWLAWAVVLPAFGQGRPDIVWMRGGHASSVTSVAFSPDGSLIASGSADYTIKLWRVSDGALVRTLTWHTDTVTSVAFSPDGSLIASGSADYTIKLWRVSDGALVATLTGHTSSVASVAFSPDGSLIASGSGDRNIRLWRVSDGALVQTYDQETAGVLSIQFSPNGQLFRYGRSDTTVVVARNPFTVEDRDPPDTFIVGGPEGGALVCREPVRFRWEGFDDATPSNELLFRWRLDGSDWSDWTRDTSVDLTGLSDGEHTFEVQARDLADRIDETPASRTFRFRNDPNPLQISNIQADAQINRATIQWTTDEPSTSQVEYRRQGETIWQRTNLDTNLVTDHTVTITGLVGNRTYEFRVLSRDECGNAAVSEIGTFTVRAVDLQVNALQVPQEIWNDTQFDIAWQITNAGGLPAAGWRDRVYFSRRGDRLDGSELIGDYPFAGTLEPGQSVSRTQVVSIPRRWISPEGTYYIIVVTDAMNQHNEGDREDNNTLARALQARLIPLPDLIVPSIQAPAAAFFGQTIEVRWQVRNQGEGATTGTWYDRVLLARDARGHWVVAEISRPNESALGAGEGYSSAANLTIPRGLVGRYYLIVETDSGRSLREENESNNRSEAIAIDIAVPPLPDLVVPQVIAPAQSYAGQSVQVRWRVENRGGRDIPAGERGFYDALYLSTDTSLDKCLCGIISTWLHRYSFN
jgi:WD40 repeat protein